MSSSHRPPCRHDRTVLSVSCLAWRCELALMEWPYPVFSRCRSEGWRHCEQFIFTVDAPSFAASAVHDVMFSFQDILGLPFSLFLVTCLGLGCQESGI